MSLPTHVKYKKYHAYFYHLSYEYQGAICSSVIRAFAHGHDGSLDRSFIVDSLSYFLFQAVLCAILSVGWCI